MLVVASLACPARTGNHHLVSGVEVGAQPIVQLVELDATWRQHHVTLGVDAANDHIILVGVNRQIPEKPLFR
jgi:hypothetical protein